jgi:hypothetical protein
MSSPHQSKPKVTPQIKKLPQKVFELASKNVILILLICGIVLVIISYILSLLKLGWWTDSLSSIVREIATIIVVSGLWTGIYESFLKAKFIEAFEDETEKQKKEIVQSLQKIVRNEIREEDDGILSCLDDQNKRLAEVSKALSEKIEKSASILRIEMGITESMEKIGLVRVFEDSYNQPDYQEMILKSRKLTILLNNGDSWLTGGNGEKVRWFEKRFLDEEKETTFILIHPEAPALEVIALREKKKAPEFKYKIGNTVKILRGLKKEKTKLNICGYKLYYPYSLYITEEFALFSPFMAASGKGSIPGYQYVSRGEDCFYTKLLKDIEALMEHTESILNYDFENLPQNKGK